MENASKALIIAGAILLSILIIALGIYVFNMAKGASSTSALDELEVSQFNQQFTNYRGKQLGSGVVDLLDKVVSNASAHKDSEERLPDIIYLDKRANKGVDGNITVTATDERGKAAVSAGFTVPTGGSAWYIPSNTTNEGNIQKIGSIRRIMADKHYYKVEFVNDDVTGLIEYIVISYD